MKTACVFLAEGFEEVEAITPVDYLRRAGIEVTMAGIMNKFPKGTHGILIQADAGIEALERIYDAIIIPGGMPGAQNLADNPSVRACIERHNHEGKIIAAICAAPAVVLHGACNMLQGKKFTGFPGTEDSVKGAHFIAEPVVVDGTLITSRGPGTAGNFAIAIIAALSGPAEAHEIAKHALVQH